MANNNADIELLAGLNLDSSEAEILRAIKILEQRIRNNEKAKISIDTKINERAIRSTIDKLQEMLKKKDLKIETKTSIEAISKEADAMLDVMESARRAAEEKLAFADANRRVRESADNTADAINRERNAMNNLDDIDYILDNINMTGQQGNSVFQQFGATLRDAFSTYTVANLLQDALYKVVDAGKEALNIVKTFDDINVDLQMATGADKDYVKGLIADYAELGGELGALTDTVVESADSFLRQGRSMEDTNQLIKDSVILSKVAKIDGEKASEILTATINGFQLAASEGSRVNDVLSSIDLNSASDASGIGEALTKVASIANNTGVSLEKTAAMIATIKNATQDADTTIGTSLKTVLSRMNSIRANKFIDEETGEALNDVEKILGAIDVTMRDVNGQFKDAEIIIDEVGMKWKDLDSNTQKAVTTAMGGVYQANKLTALFDNYSQVIELTKIAEESQDQALKKFNDSYLPSLEAKTNALKSSLQSLATATISDEFYASVLNSTKAIVDMTAESGILKSALIGISTAGAIYTFQHLATYMRNATQEFANLGEAMQITRNANGTIEDIQRLIDLTGGLSQSQTRLLLSTQNLTNAQKTAILVNQYLAQGMTEDVARATAEATMRTWGFTAAQNTATSAVITFSNALRGIASSLIANPLVLVTTAVTVGVTAFNKYNQELEETRRKNLETGESAKEHANNLEELYIEYTRLASIQDKTSTEEEAFKTVIEDVTKALGNKADALKDLKTGTEEYTKSLKEATKAELEEQYANAKVGAKAAEEALQKETWSTWSGSTITIHKNENMTKVPEHVAALAVVEDILKEYEDLGNYGIEWEPVKWDEDHSNMDAVVEYYNALVEARTKLVTGDNADFLMSSDIYKNINATINALSDSVKQYTEQQYNALKLQYEYENAVPSTAEEFEAMENAILNASGAGEYFKQTLKDYLAEDFSGLYAKIADEMPDVDVKEDDTSAIPVLSLSENERKALDDYAEKLSLITKLRTEWADANASEKMDLLSSISEQFSDFDLSGLESGKQTIEEVLSDLGASALKTVKGQISKYSDELGNMLAEAFGEVNITPYFEEVEKYQNLLNQVQSGKIYNSDQIAEIIRDNEDLADAIKIVENGYKLEEEAVISLLNTSITAYNKQVSSAKITTQDIIEARQKLIEAYGIEATALQKIVDIQLSDVSNILTDDDMKWNYGLTAEQIQRVNEYVDYVRGIRAQYKELYETIETDSNSASKSFEYINNSIEKEINNLEKVIDRIEKQNEKLEKQKDKYDGIISAIQDVIKEKQDLIQADIDSLNEQNDILNENINNYDLILSTVEDVYNAEIDAIKAQQDAIDDKIEAMQEANDEAEKALALEKAHYELERARNQRTVKLYAGENKGFIYTQDEQAVKDAKENLANLEYEATISALEKERDSLDGVIEELEKYKELWADVANAHEKAKGISLTKSLFGEDYERAILLSTATDIEDFANRYSSALAQIDANESVIRNLESEIDKYNKLSEKWDEIATAKEDSINRQNAAEKFGADWQAKVLDGRLIDIEGFKKEYIDIQTQIEDNQNLIDSYNEKVEYYNNLKERWDEIIENLEDNTEALNTFEQNFSDVQNRIAEDAGNTTKVIEETISAYEKLLGIKGDISTEDINPIDNIHFPNSSGGKSGAIDTILGIVEKTPKFANGGIITKNNKSPLDFLAKMVGEDKTVFVKDGEIILTRANQTELMQKFAGMANLVNPVVPNYTVPKYDFSMVNRTPQVNIGDVHVHCTGVTSQQVQKQIGDTLQREFGGMALKALQMSHRMR